MKKHKGVGINSWAEMNQNFFNTNEMDNNLINPMVNMEWASGNSVLMDSSWGQNSIADMMKGMDLAETFKSFGLTDLIQPTISYQDIGIGLQLKDMFKDMFKDIGVGLHTKDLFSDIGLGTFAGSTPMLETLQHSFETSAMAVSSVLPGAYTGLNTGWMDTWNCGVEIFTAGLSDSLYNVEEFDDNQQEAITIKTDEIEAFKKTLNDLSAVNEQNWQQKFMSAHDKWKEKNPVYSNLIKVLFKIFLFIISLYFQPVIAPINTATVRSEPSTQSATVAIFDQDQRLTVIGDDVPYYYQIEFCEPTTGAIKTGWVSKKSVMIIEENSIE